MRLAHFSDLHVTLPPGATPRAEWTTKRALNAFSYHLNRRARRYADSAVRIAALLQDAMAQTPDHFVCTGDLTATSLEGELRQASELMAVLPRERTTLLPGNHDRYVAMATGRFEHYFGVTDYPRVDRCGQLAIVSVDVARATPLHHSRGLCGEAQRAALRSKLQGLDDCFVVVALHYALLRSDGSRDERGHRLQDDRELLALLDDPTLPIDLVLHGHVHAPYVVKSARRHLVCAGSGTDLRQACGYNVYDIDPVARAVQITRRRYSPQGFVSQPTTLLQLHRG